jgi:xanthine/uracil permease
MEKPEDVEIRKAPKVLAFALTGAVIGVLAALVLYGLIPEDQRSSRDILGLLLVALGSLGLGLGVVTAIFLDLITSRRVKKASAIRAEKAD